MSEKEKLLQKLQTMTIDDLMARVNAAQELVVAGNVLEIEGQFGADVTGDKRDDVTGTSSDVALDNPILIAATGIFADLLDAIDANPGDSNVEFAQKKKIKLFGIISQTVTFHERLRMQTVPAAQADD